MVRNKHFRPGRHLRATAWSFAIMLGALFFAGCASQATTPESSPESVAVRAQNRWDALLAGDFETAYSYYSPGYRSTTSVVDYAVGIKLRRVRWTSAEHLEQDCSENTCTVRFRVGYSVIGPVPGVDKFDGSNFQTEKWVKTDGQWWYLPKSQ
jgi:hypothetical protein